MKSAGSFRMCIFSCFIYIFFYFTIRTGQTAAAAELAMDNDLSSQPERDKQLEFTTDTKASTLHKVDSLNLILYTFLLILTVFTIWFLKHRRLRFVHETGLTLMYGLIVGFLIWIASGDTRNKALLVVPANEAEARTLNSPPDFLRFRLSSSSNLTKSQFGTKTVSNNVSSVFRYKFVEEERERDIHDDNLMETQATFDPEVFFNVLLPPIMFNAGYSLKRRHFFRNIGSILTFAIAGTTLSCVVVGFIIYAITYWANIYSFTLNESMLFGALISATDPVTVLAVFNDLHVENDLFALLFGESALNDATAIVLFRTIEKYSSPVSGSGAFSAVDSSALFRSFGTFVGIFLGSVGLGAFCGCAAALITKFTKIRDFPLLETSLFVLISYMSFLTSEACGMTGVVSALFCGICQAHYTYNNLSEESRMRTKQFFELLNFLAENFIFTYIGVSMFTSRAHSFNVLFIITAFIAVAAGRAAYIYPFSFLLNLKRRPKIPVAHQHMMMFAGLRGAVAFALAIRNTSTNERCLMYTATALIVIFTVIFNGGLTLQVVNWLKIRTGSDHDVELQPQLQSTAAPTPTDRLNSNNPWDKSFLPRQWYNFDKSFLKPMLTNCRPTLMDTSPQCCLPLARMLTTTEQLMGGESSGQERNLSRNSGVDIFPVSNDAFHNGRRRDFVVDPASNV